MVGMLQACVWALSQTFFSLSPLSLSISSRKKGCPLFASTFPCRPPVGIEKYKKKQPSSPPTSHLRILPSSSSRVLVVLPSFPLSLISVCLVPHTNSTPPSPLSPKNNPPPADKMVQKIYVTYNDVSPPI